MMCTDGVSQLVLEDEVIGEKMANPVLDIVHKQVVMMLYSLDASRQLDRYRELLPLYLSMDWTQCAEILHAIETAGLVVHSDNGIQLVHPVSADAAASACGCHA
jgi:hypothetical protein